MNFQPLASVKAALIDEMYRLNGSSSRMDDLRRMTDKRAKQTSMKGSIEELSTSEAVAGELGSA